MPNWIEQKLASGQELARLSEKPVPLRLLHDEPLFAVPRDMMKTFDRDLQAASILKKGERGRTVDFHALRHTFGTHFSKNSVAPRTAQVGGGFFLRNCACVPTSDRIGLWASACL